MAIDLGDVIRCSWQNKSPSGGLVNADTVTLTIIQPDDTQVVQTVSPLTTGTYQYDFVTAQAGRHVVQWCGVGTNPGASVDIFDVRSLTPLYLISLAEMKDQLKITGTSDDEALRRYIESATTAVERILGEVAVKRTFTEEHRLPDYFRGLGQANPAMTLDRSGAPRQLALNRFPVVSLTSVARVDGTMTWNVGSLHVESATGVVDVISGPEFSGQLSVTYVAGYQVIPSEFTQAAGFIVEHLWQTRRGGRGAPVPGGMGVTQIPGIGYAIPNQAVEVLGGYGIPGFA
ncbi:head-tail connector protein [Amycolatopsis kentuckyensis]|uniref:head-tail connector protein n=1 Tax=Amycolatopsis kentuckyensis TaxID=218823 RepID=UPI000A3ADD73|nr:head-tail connector protein [Amycolatopsis kentuckyensis]